mgnify:FL=1
MNRRQKAGLLWAAFLGMLIVSVMTTHVSLIVLGKRGSRFFDIAGQMIPPAWDYGAAVLQPLWATIQMSFAGTVLGACLGLIGAVCANNYINRCPWLRIPFKAVVHLIRTIPALILALFCTFLLGLGALAGTVALTVYTTAVLTRMGYEDMENMDLRAANALEVTGCGPWKAFVRTILPAVLPGYLTNVLYMLEANVRHAAILGYVGAGGIGLLLNEQLAWRQYSQVGMIIFLLFLVVIAAESLSEWLRHVLTQQAYIPPAAKRAGTAAVFILLVLSLATLPWSVQQTGWHAAAAIVSGLVHPDSAMLFSLAHDDVPYLVYETLCIAFLGTLGGVIIAAWFSFTASFRLMPRPIALASRTVLLLIRTIPVFVYGLMWIRVTGPGPFAGVMTLAVCSIGLLAKRFLIAIDDMDMRPFLAYRAMGMPLAAAVRYAVLPQLRGPYTAAVLYRLDINLRDAAVLGLVGAGGIGTSLILAMNQYKWPEAGALLWGIIILVTVVEILSEKSRRHHID